MKTVDEVRKRLEKLRFRCLRQHVRLISSKKPQNCVHNFEHVPHPQRNEIPTEVEMVPRVVSTLVVIQPEKPIRLCMYGSDKPESWNGDVCDVDDTAQICPYFKSRVSEERAVEEFDLLMVDDDYVFEHHKDIATLQWVLGERIHRTPLSTWEKFLLWFDGFMRRIVRPAPRLSKFSRGHLMDPDPPEELWRDVDAEDSGKRSP